MTRKVIKKPQITWRRVIRAPSTVNKWVKFKDKGRAPQVSIGNRKAGCATEKNNLQILKNFDIIITETNKKYKKERGGYYDKA